MDKDELAQTVLFLKGTFLRYNHFHMSFELQLFVLLSLLLLLPKILLRFRIPTAITAMVLGVLVGVVSGAFEGDSTVNLLATLGITSLFLFAGLEVDVDELRKDAGFLSKHLVTTVVILVVCAVVLGFLFNLSTRVSLLLSLGLLTPSTGFILDSLPGFHYTPNQEKWIRSKAISNEIVALIIMFLILQSTSTWGLIISTTIIVLIIFILPMLFQFFFARVAPFAPDSEVAFLILIALLCGVITRKIGAYYLVGAFIVGITAGRFEHFLSRDKSKDIMYVLKLFFSFFIPFYFFKAGMAVDLKGISLKGILAGSTFLLFFIPLRVVMVGLSLRFFQRDSWKDRIEISMSLLPTLVFGLVIASILRTLKAPPYIITGLILYTLVSSILPAFFLRKAPPVEYGPKVKV
ncbi:MAG: cation:proton antiporter [Bdellovibrionaceae bacterium]|nr:cation:proton antiporter [Bdellovibrionales bacterium]MCB9084056.1 cation:proton antiporter [Pseudobdellovibrionaceae bacterium]